jgi:hypothetical protein
VDRHPDSDTLLAFREHRLAGPAVAEVALHMGLCDQCTAVTPSAGRTALRAFVPSDGHLSPHLSDAELDVLVEGRAHHAHLDSCPMCRAEVEDLRRFDAGDRVTPFRSRPARRWLLAAAAVFAVLALSAIAFFVRRPNPAVTPVTASNAPVPAPPATVTPATVTPAPAVVASLVDGAGRIALLKDGTIAGVVPRSPRDTEDARAVLAGRRIPIPTFLAAMPGAVRGGGGSTHPLRAVEPFRSAVLEARPRFSWTPVPGARSYRVEVFDADYEEIARSEALNATSWRPSKPLPAGMDLSWHVVADTADGELSSAGSDRAEAVFRVLAPKEASEVGVGVAQYPDSHLLRGLLYRRHGLLNDAEREFRRLAAQNPDSPIARSLIASVSR